MPIENKYFVAAAAVLFAFTLWFSDGNLAAAFGMLALTLAVGWVVRRVGAGK